MDLDSDLDTHLCLRCQTTIVGLDNYVLHKRSTCPCLVVANKEIIIETVKPKGIADEKLLSKGLSAAAVVSTKEHQQLQPDDFFLSLELKQNKTKRIAAMEMNKRSHKPEERIIDDDTTSNVSSIHFESTLEDMNQFNIEGTSHVVECDVDYQYETYVEPVVEYGTGCPPRGHTGGKWKPGVAQSRCTQWLADPSSPVREIDLQGVEGLKRNPRSNRCLPCDLHFKSNSLFLEHLLTPSHWSKSRSNPDNAALLLKYSSKLASKAPFSCALCHFYFNNLKYLVEHWAGNVPEHNTKKIVFFCSLCKIYCTNVKNVKEHLLDQSHTGNVTCKTPLVISAVKRNGLFACNSCSYKARSYSAFDAHVKCKHACKSGESDAKDKVKKERKEEEKNEGKDDEENERKDDEELSISNEVEHACKHCGLKLSSALLLKDHIANVHANVAFKCLLCPLTFKRRSHLLKHKKIHSVRNSNTAKENVEGKFSCKKCSFKNDIEAEVLFHEAFHTDPVLKPIVDGNTESKQRKKSARLYQCPLCEMLFRKPCLLEHLLAHTGEKPFKCEFCDASFSRKSSVYSHQKGLHGGKNLACDQCSFKTHKRSKLKLHMETHKINRPRPFMCDICGLSFMQSVALRHHLKVHSGYKTHLCSFEGCEKSFRSASELVVHYRTHTDERPFLCTQCGYAAKTRHQLTKHERSHTGEKPFKCTFCSYKAALSAQLWRHMRIHTGSRPYSCPHCEYTCNTSENLRKHVLKSKKHKGLNVYVCPYCPFGCDHLKDFQCHVLEDHKDNVDANDKHSPTYFSLLSGVYDRNISKLKSEASDVSNMTKRKPKGTGKFALADSPRDYSDGQLTYEHVVLDDLVLEVVVPKDSGNRNGNDLESKTSDTLSQKNSEEVEESASEMEGDRGTNSGNTITLSVSSGIDGNTETESLILSNVNENLNGETIYIYVPV